MTWLKNTPIRDKEILDERLELTDKDSLYFLGPNLTLRQCAIVLKASARNLLFKGVVFIDCTIEVKQELKNHQEWVFSSLKGCRFKGKMSGCEFGRWPDYAPGWEHGSIEDCDFSEARLHGCRFHSCDPLTLRLPSWPCFTLLDPLRRYRDWLAHPWPGNLGSTIIEIFSTDPPSTVAVTWSAALLAKHAGCSEDEIRAVLSRCEGILC